MPMSRNATYFILLFFAIATDLVIGVYLGQSTISDWNIFLANQSSNYSVFIYLAPILLWLSLGSYFKIYVQNRADRYLRVALRLLSHVIVYFITIEVIAVYLFQRIPKAEDIVFLGTFSSILLLNRFFVFILIRQLRASNKHFQDNVIILGEKTQINDLQNVIKRNPHIGFISLNVSVNEIASFTKKEFAKQQIKAVFIHNNYTVKKTYKRVMEQAALLQIPIYVFADHDELIKSSKVDYFGFIPVYRTRYSPLTQAPNRVVKRAFDIIFSSIVILAILSWLYPIVGLLIKLESKGPILFIQRRNGIGNEVFLCYKFRSMSPNNKKVQTQKNDSRVTRIGKFIRKTSIDELPQFFNVLKGDMSVVGPRPHMEIHNEEYKKHVESFQIRHSIKPGITGMAQTLGFRGEIREDRDIINRIKYDIFYVRHWTFATDIKIIIRTVANVINGEDKAY